MRRICHDMLMRMVVGILLVILLLGFGSLSSVSAADHPILYLFWGDGCPHCEKEKKFLPTLQAKYPELEMRWFEVWEHDGNRKLAEAIRQVYDLKTSSVPITYIGRWVNAGYLSDEETGKELEAQIIACLQQECIDTLEMVGPRQDALNIRKQAAQRAPVGWELFPATAPARKLAPPQPQATPQTTLQTTPAPTDTTQPQTDAQQPPPNKGNVFSFTIFGKKIELDVTRVGLPAFTFVIALLDGFNPCAMWVLSFLLTLVIYAKSRTKILLIGGIFVVASGVVYFMFMVAWLNVFIFVQYVKALQIIVGLVAVVMGLINCKDFFFFKQGVSLTIPESAQPKLFKKMRAVVHTTALPAMILGTVALAFTANLIELLCTAGFPAIYTRILTLQKNFSDVQYYLYLVLYNVIYVIPLAAIVGVFAWKMGGRKLSEKEGRILKLIGGVLMLALGLILLFKPKLLMFG